MTKSHTKISDASRMISFSRPGKPTQLEHNCSPW